MQVRCRQHTSEKNGLIEACRKCIELPDVINYYELATAADDNAADEFNME